MANRKKIASLLIFIFIGVILMKPVHYLLVDSNSNHITQTKSEGKPISHSHDCDICLFMIQAFTSQQFTELQQIYNIYVTLFSEAETQTLAYGFTPQSSLRAPPVFRLLQ